MITDPSQPSYPDLDTTQGRKRKFTLGGDSDMFVVKHFKDSRTSDDKTEFSEGENIGMAPRTGRDPLVLSSMLLIISLSI